MAAWKASSVNWLPSTGWKSAGKSAGGGVIGLEIKPTPHCSDVEQVC